MFLRCLLITFSICFSGLLNSSDVDKNCRKRPKILMGQIKKINNVPVLTPLQRAEDVVLIAEQLANQEDDLEVELYLSSQGQQE